MTTNRPAEAMATPSGKWLALAGRAYVPGAHLDAALAVGRRHQDAGRALTFGYFNGARESPAEVATQTAAIVDALVNPTRPGYVSIKAPALAYQLDALDVVLDRCAIHGQRAHFDSHDIGHQELTLACAERAVEHGLHAGLSLPGRWTRSLDDARHLCALGIRARVVKGEWPDPARPDADAHSGFLEVVEVLCRHGAREAAVATHDPALAREALQRLLQAGTDCELELLHGLPQGAMVALAREMGVPVRVYVPFGIAWRPYALRKALRQPRILGWLMRDLVRGAWQRTRSDR